MSDVRKIPKTTSPSDLRRAMKVLGAAFGVKDKNTFMQVLLGNTGNQSISLEDISQSENSTPLQELADSILSVQGDGLYGDELAEKIKNYCSDPKDELGRTLKNQPTEESSSFISITSSSSETDVENYGFLRDASIDKICSIEQKVSNDKTRQTVSVIEFHDPLLGFNNRDSVASSVFLQALPSIEISKALPYFDAKAIVEGSSIISDPAGGNEVFGAGISIYKFLSGERIEKEDTIIKELVSAVPVEFVVKDPDINGVAGEEPQQASLEPKMTVGGMELFTAPQTMVRGDWDYHDLNATNSLPTDENGKAISIPKENKVLDKFRPLMTIESFNVQVTPATGMLATKSAKMKIKLHDRSRLNEVIPLIAPAKMGTCDIQVEWGWSHPVTDPEVNPYGTLINSMRCKELYGVMNSSYSFTPEGQVDIDLKLFTKGAQKASFELITNYEGGEHPSDSLKKVVTSMRNAMKNLNKVGFPLNESMGAPDILGKSTSVTGLLSLTKAQRNKIKNFVNNMKNGRQSAEGRAAWEELSTNWSDSETAVTSFHEKIKEEYESKIKSLCSKSNKGSDPYLVTDWRPSPRNFGIPSTRLYDIRHTTHVSLAKVLLEMVVKPLHATNRFEEIQLVFYPMNEYSMFANKLNVGQYPINKSKLKSRLVNEMKKSPSVTIQKFLNMIRSVFTNNISDDIYGLSKTYENTPDDDGKYKLRKKYTDSEKNKQKFTQLKSKILEIAYPEPGANRTFKKPNIHMFVESVVNENNKECHILRLHFFDKNATSYSSYAEMWNSTSSGELGMIGKYVSSSKALGKANEQLRGVKKEEKKKIEDLINQRKSRVTRYQNLSSDIIDKVKNSNLLSETPITWKDAEGNEVTKYQIAGGPDQIRGFLTSNMPTLKYGTEFSGILNASLSTNADPMMETIHMQRQGGTSSSPDGFDSGLPMQIKPVTLTVDTFGCPFVNFGQQYFIDFSTNTTVDDIYAVTGVSHSLTTTDFKTQIKFTPLNASARYKSLVDKFDEAIGLSKHIAKNQE